MSSIHRKLQRKLTGSRPSGPRAPSTKDPGERLESVRVLYRNAGGSRFNLKLDPAAGYSMSEVKDMLRGSLTVYDKEGDGFEATVFAQLDHIAATFDRYWANESDPSAGAEHAKRLDALSEELGVHWAYLAAGNVQWLEQRGHLKVDDFNGMLFYFSLPNPVRPGERILVVRSSLDPTPEQQQMLIRER